MLHDEYVKEGNITGFYTGKQCYGPESVNNCLANSNWSAFIGKGCGNEAVLDCVESDQNYTLEISCYMGGCYHPNLYRPIFNSIMRNHHIEPFSFGFVNERLICLKLKELTGRATGICGARSTYVVAY